MKLILLASWVLCTHCCLFFTFAVKETNCEGNQIALSTHGYFDVPTDDSKCFPYLEKFILDLQRELNWSDVVVLKSNVSDFEDNFNCIASVLNEEGIMIVIMEEKMFCDAEESSLRKLMLSHGIEDYLHVVSLSNSGGNRLPCFLENPFLMKADMPFRLFVIFLKDFPVKLADLKNPRNSFVEINLISPYQENAMKDQVFRIRTLLKLMSSVKTSMNTWDPATGFKRSLPTADQLCKHLTGITVTLSTNDYPPYLTLGQAPEGHLTPEEGPESFLVQTLRDALGFTYLLVLPGDEEWGRKDENGSWTGMVGDVVQMKADLAFNALLVTEERFEVVDYITSYFFDPLTFFTSAPVKLNEPTLIFYPFTLEVWIAILVTVVATSILLHRLTVFSRKVSGDPNVTFGHVFWFLTVSLTSETMKSPMSHNAVLRIALSSWWIFVAIIMFSYSGILLSFLVVPRMEKPIETIPELSDAVAHKKIICGTMINSALYESFQDATEGILGVLGRSMKEDKLKNSMVDEIDGIQRVMWDKYAFVTSRLSGSLYATQLGIEKFFISRDDFYITTCAVAIGKLNPCREAFDYATLKMIEAGLPDKWYKDELLRLRIPVALNATSSSEEEATPITLNELQGAFFLFCAGVLISLCALLAEIVFHKCRSTMLSRKSLNRRRNRTATEIAIVGRS